jgi:hypothetical protein
VCHQQQVVGEGEAVAVGRVAGRAGQLQAGQPLRQHTPGRLSDQKESCHGVALIEINPILTKILCSGSGKSLSLRQLQNIKTNSPVCQM